MLDRGGQIIDIRITIVKAPNLGLEILCLKRAEEMEKIERC